MRFRIAGWLRNHRHVLLIVPLVVIAITWPTFPRIFDSDEFWLHVRHHDKWLRIWDAWHVEKALAGHAELYYTDFIFHPQGTSLAFYAMVVPHALLMIALETIISADDAYNLLFLLILCFNAFSGYALIGHLIKDKWISLFGAVVFAAATPFPSGQTAPDIITIGTLPLTIHFIHRFVSERRLRFAALAGLCAGITAFVGVYVFAIGLMTVGIFVLMKALSFWRQRAFWSGLLVLVSVCGLTSVLRFYPMLRDHADLAQAVESYQGRTRSNDVLEHFVLRNNPLTGHLFGAPLVAYDDSDRSEIRQEYKDAYLGYINLFLIGCAFLLRPRRRLLPWIVILLFFAALRLGSYLTFNGIHYTDIALPDRLLKDAFPALFGNIGRPQYYQIGVVMPLAALSAFGLAALLRSKPARSRRLVALLCIVVVCIEFNTPRIGQTLYPQSTAFIAWLQREPEDEIKLIHLPLGVGQVSHYYYLQTVADYPHANGLSSRLKAKAFRYIEGNWLLRAWYDSRSVHCLPHSRPQITQALEQLLGDGFTHVVFHNWIYGDFLIGHTFWQVPTAYHDEFVSVYRLNDLRYICEHTGTSDSAASHSDLSILARTPWVLPGKGSSILSFHPSDSIDADRFAYYSALFSEWESLLHLYVEDGELVTQNSGDGYMDISALQNNNQVIYITYDGGDSHAMPGSHYAVEGFDLCQRETHEGGSIIESYVRRDFSCALIASDSPFQVQYDNGAMLNNLLVQSDSDTLEIQLMWIALPDEAHSVSLQVFDAAGDKALGQDSVIGHITLDRQRIDVSSLPPGDYRVKLILYNFETGAIVSGTVSEDGARFDRELTTAMMERF